MSISFIFFVLLLSSCTSSVLSAENDELVLLKIKEQLGNPSGLSSWVAGTDFCHWAHIDCKNTSRVKTLLLYIFDVSAPFPGAICNLTELENLSLSDMPGLYGSIPSCVSKLLKLIVVTIQHTSLSGPVPNFSSHENLIIMDLSINKLSGSIPPSFSTLPNLVILDLSSNRLTGTIPPGLIRNNASSWLDLSHNNLTGEIPKYYGGVNYTVFAVSGNRLSGDASFLFGKQKTAGDINLSSNDFEFDLSNVEIPKKLALLNLSNNKIKGRVPDSLKSVHLSKLNLSNNKLCGEIPQGGYMDQYNADSFANNTCLCGSPLPPCSAPPVDSTP